MDTTADPLRRDEEATPELLGSPSEVYHEGSKLHPGDRWTQLRIALVNSSPAVQRVISQPSAGCPGAPIAKLPPPSAASGRSFDDVVLSRRSVRNYSGEPISLAALSRLCHLGYGISASMVSADGCEWRFRTAPSAGGLYPIELHCLALRVEGLPAGQYLYEPQHHQLARLSTDEGVGVLREATRLEAIDRAAVCFSLVAVLPRIKFKYGERGYRFALLDAGHVAQNLLLAAAADGLAAVPIGGFVDDAVNDLLRLDGCDEAVLYLVVVGKPIAPETPESAAEPG